MPRPIEAVGTSTAAFVGVTPKGPVKQAVKLTDSAEFGRVFGTLNSSMPLGHVVRHFFDNGGTEAHVVRVNRSSDGLLGTEKKGTGIYALDKVDLFNILVLPDEDVDFAAQAAAVAYCERRRAFMIIDAPETVTTVGAAEAWIGSLPPALLSPNAAFYFPRIRAADPSMNGVVRSFPAAGAIAGVYARTDMTRGVWKAPAGAEATLTGVAGLTMELDEHDNMRLNPLGLNCLRTFPVFGTVCWGARTARGVDRRSDEFKYVPVRRLALFVEESILRGTQWAASEMNNESLWTEMRDSISVFMHSLFRQGAFAGMKPNEAYFVKCDASTTTQTDIDSGRVNVEIGFAPLKPSEFVILRLQQIAGGIA